MITKQCEKQKGASFGSLYALRFPNDHSNECKTLCEKYENYFKLKFQVLLGSQKVNCVLPVLGMCERASSCWHFVCVECFK